MMRKILLAFIIGTSFLAAYPRPYTSEKIDTLKILFEKMIDAGEIPAKKNINDHILNIFNQILIDSVSFNASFDEVPGLGVIVSPDSVLKIYNWNMPLKKGQHKYFGIIQCEDGRHFVLSDKSQEIKEPEQQSLSYNRWFGALYYDIIMVEKYGRKYYTLLGFDFNNLFTSKKIIEILYFDEKGAPAFGFPVFQMKNELKSRVIFEFSTQIVMSLKYKKDKGMIIFDHLAPSEPKYQGIYHYYGPDFTFDAFVFENGSWTLIEDVDVTF
jgi:hypothetical protein